MRPRTLGRRLALQYLYQYDLTGGGCEPVDEFLAAHTDREEVRSFARDRIREALDRREDIDRRLRTAAANYSLERIATVERNVLRLGAAEILSNQAPYKVAIDEAVKLAKTFGGPESGAFVNGILDRIAHEERP